MNKIILKEIESKSIVWFKMSNSYAIFEKLTAEIITKIDSKIPINVIEDYCFKQIDAPLNKIKDFISEVKKIYENNSMIESNIEREAIIKNAPIKYYSERKYNINNLIFLLCYETENHELIIHPTFAHLETTSEKEPNYTYTFFNHKNNILFFKNNIFIGKWHQQESHVFEGKVSMHLLIDIYKKPEKEWMGVFHASAVSNGTDSILFLGDSGNGKSTSLALLNANGYTCIADDFVPIDNQKNIHTYPAAISIKKNSVKTLLSYYPELEKSAEYHFKKLNKTVRFLPPKKIDFEQQLKCKALVFIKYNPEIKLELNSISKVKAFQQIIPDSWISPLEENANIFLDWFIDLPCFQLTYSDNNNMINTVSKLFNNEL